MNAREELIKVVANTKIKCAKISLGDYRFEPESKIFILKIGYNNSDYEIFLNSLDFDYDDGYGGQELFGIVWLEDNTWLNRGEYDGSEWWNHQQLPEIPKECL